MNTIYWNFQNFVQLKWKNWHFNLYRRHFIKKVPFWHRYSQENKYLFRFHCTFQQFRYLIFKGKCHNSLWEFAVFAAKLPEILKLLVFCISGNLFSAKSPDLFICKLWKHVSYGFKPCVRECFCLTVLVKFLNYLEMSRFFTFPPLGTYFWIAGHISLSDWFHHGWWPAAH